MVNPGRAVKTIVQCDFDGTITLEDEAFLLLDAFADGDWRQFLTEYREGKISVGDFNTRAFALVKADEQTLVSFVRGTVKFRPGFGDLVSSCQREGFQLVVVSNGLDFYIKVALKDIAVESIRVFAAKAWFRPTGMEVKYIGPYGNQLQDGFKEAYTRSFLKKGYRVIYVGNGPSDLPAARLAHYVFATADLLTCCKQSNLDCTPFIDLSDVARGLEF